MRLDGKTAIVTGGGRGIGKAITLRYLAEGARVVMTDRDESYVYDVRDEVDPALAENLLVMHGDITNAAHLDALFETAIDRFGSLDVLVNNAAWTTCERHFLDYDERDFWDSVVENNFTSVYLASMRAVRLMVERRSGVIINLSSIGATKAHRRMVAYDACKGGVEAFTRALAVELGPWNIRVNAISPASVQGVAVARPDDATIARADPKDFETPIVRIGVPDDITGAAVFLASEDSSFMTGQVLSVDGGLGIQSRPMCNRSALR
jgi:NAD(P)-dependent dehydrogenase (short-subunit alcohol dehydrogenase family)